MRIALVAVILVCVGCKSGHSIVGSWSVATGFDTQTDTYRSDGTCEWHSHLDSQGRISDLYMRGTYTTEGKTLTVTLTKSHYESSAGRVRDRDITPRPDQMDMIWIDNDHLRVTEKGPPLSSADYTRIKP